MILVDEIIRTWYKLSDLAFIESEWESVGSGWLVGSRWGEEM